MASVDLGALLSGKRVIACVGAGGVGKTTLSAALGVAAARQGRKTLVLTVDPARRLANALGLASFDEQVQRIPVGHFADQGVSVAVPLDVAMLNVKQTFDRLVTHFAQSDESRERILSHPFYKQASTTLAGTQEYMAMSRLYECVTEHDYDLVVLDTPPSKHALDFIEAPDRLVALLDSPAFRLLLASTGRGAAGARGLLRPGSVVVRGLGRFTGTEMFSQLLSFFASLSETFDGFIGRARAVRALLRSDAAACLIVSACDSTTIDEGFYLRERLRHEEMEVAAWLLNRVSASVDLPAGTDMQALTRRLRTALAAANGPDIAAQVAVVATSLAKRARRDRALMDELAERVADATAVLPVARRAKEPTTLAELSDLADELLRTSPVVGRSHPTPVAAAMASATLADEDTNGGTAPDARRHRATTERRAK